MFFRPLIHTKKWIFFSLFSIKSQVNSFDFDVFGTILKQFIAMKTNSDGNRREKPFWFTYVCKEFALVFFCIVWMRRKYGNCARQKYTMKVSVSSYGRMIIICFFSLPDFTKWIILFAHYCRRCVCARHIHSNSIN